MAETQMTIGEVARRAGIRSSAIRFYEDQGVLPLPERVGGQRRYGPEVVRKLQILQVAQEAGFSLPEIRDLLAGSESGHASTELRALAEKKLPDVRALIGRAQAMEAWLETATTCTCSDFQTCGLFDLPDPGDWTASG